MERVDFNNGHIGSEARRTSAFLVAPGRFHSAISVAIHQHAQQSWSFSGFDFALALLPGAPELPLIGAAMSTYPYTNSFALIRSILILIVVFGIIGSISQLVSGLFALANAQDVTNNNDHERKTVELGAVAMLIMALICFTFELIGLLGALLRKVSVVSVFAVVMAIAIVVNCFIGDGGLKLLIILLNLIMTALSGVFVYMCIRQKEIDAFKQRHSMSISAIHESVSRDSVFHSPG